MVEKNAKHRDFANRLNALLDKKGLTVRDLSLACNVTYEMARRYTLGAAKPRDEKMLRIAEWLDVQPSWLDYGESDSGQSSDDSKQVLPDATTAKGDSGEFDDLSEEEIRLIRTFRRFPDIEAKNMLLVFELRLKELQTHYKKYFQD
ncbi:hypothetical protein C5952_04955 [Cronobacter sakazakii]|uniref:helix-turn-helix domain-containing protein n=1 Tax=Cronobacter sakazakii TaxID=28141 RepID=UPI000CFCEF40|nr:helix-turn-helix domain-containing protein [Cronobacter sakazakii]ELY6363044.1 helix-turn-helix domain-containing protein [Cronobacter sakazakii]PQX67358.1 hypothetical protein C5952_04955 [Cronobacter sakazakii]PQY05789.1 hypothetical protein C5936_10915 [Cronobacter sakazakii]